MMCPAPAKFCLRKVNEILSSGTCIESEGGQGRPERAAAMCDGVEKTKADFPGVGSQLAAGTTGYYRAPVVRCTKPSRKARKTGAAFFDVAAVRHRASNGISGRHSEGPVREPSRW